LIGLRSDNARVEVEMIVYRSGKRCIPDVNPTKLDRYTIYSRSTRSSTRSLYDRFSNLNLLDCYSIFLTRQKIRVGSQSHADQGRPLRSPPITHADRARPVPDRLIVLDRVDLIGGENTAL
jgi:hypothetical protein